MEKNKQRSFFFGASHCLLYTNKQCEKDKRKEPSCQNNINECIILKLLWEEVTFSICLWFQFLKVSGICTFLIPQKFEGCISIMFYDDSVVKTKQFDTVLGSTSYVWWTTFPLIVLDFFINKLSFYWKVHFFILEEKHNLLIKTTQINLSTC